MLCRQQSMPSAAKKPRRLLLCSGRNVRANRTLSETADGVRSVKKGDAVVDARGSTLLEFIFPFETWTFWPPRRSPSLSSTLSSARTCGEQGNFRSAALGTPIN